VGDGGANTVKPGAQVLSVARENDGSAARPPVVFSSTMRAHVPRLAELDKLDETRLVSKYREAGGSGYRKLTREGR
jgi:hypothetical protein